MNAELEKVYGENQELTSLIKERDQELIKWQTTLQESERDLVIAKELKDEVEHELKNLQS